MQRLTVSLLLAMVAGSASACSSEDVPLAGVTGSVTFNGVPSRAEILFEPVSAAADSEATTRTSGGRPSTAYADLDGKFVLGFGADNQGAVIGRHRVTVKVFRPTREGEPASYEAVVEPIKVARLIRQVESDSNHFHFAITY